MSQTAPGSSKAPDAEYNLLHHLSTKQPKLQATPRSKSRTNTKHQGWRRPSRIKKWEDFDCASLMKCCGGIFCEMLKHTIEPMKFPHLEDTIRFSDEDALEKHYVSQWTHPIVATALSHAQRQASGRGLRPPFVAMVAGGNAQSISGHRPDWARTRATVPDDPNQPVNILPGDTKVSYKWKSTEIVPKEVGKNDLEKNWFWPLRQIFTYCMNAKTRYGYIISDEEVVAVRVRAPPHERLAEDKPNHRAALSEDRGTLEYIPIYESTQDLGGEERLTMNLAIWWLHLLAANDKSIRATYGPLRDEVLGGLCAAPTLHGQGEASAEIEQAVTDRASPATTARTYDNATESGAIFSPQLSTYGLSFSSLAGLADPVESMHSWRSSRPKRKRDDTGPEAGASKLKKRKSTAKRVAAG